VETDKQTAAILSCEQKRPSKEGVFFDMILNMKKFDETCFIKLHRKRIKPFPGFLIA
jgi:hypothetical protein